MTDKKKVLTNKVLGKTEIISKQFPLNLSPKGKVHTNPDGSKVNVEFITTEKCFGKKKLDKVRGSSWMFDSYLSYSTWLWWQGFQMVPTEEL